MRNTRLGLSTNTLTFFFYRLELKSPVFCSVLKAIDPPRHPQVGGAPFFMRFTVCSSLKTFYAEICNKMCFIFEYYSTMWVWRWTLINFLPTLSLHLEEKFLYASGNESGTLASCSAYCCIHPSKEFRSELCLNLMKWNFLYGEHF